MKHSFIRIIDWAFQITALDREETGEWCYHMIAFQDKAENCFLLIDGLPRKFKSNQLMLQKKLSCLCEGTLDALKTEQEAFFPS